VAKLLELRQRIRAVENIQTITRTLATVAAARLARTRRRAAGLREYARCIREILREQQAYVARVRPDLASSSPLLAERRPVRNVALLVLTSDRGMCGGYNLEACRLASEVWEERRKAGQGVRFVLKGRRGATFLARRGAEIAHAEGWARRAVGAEDVERLLGVLLGLHASGAVDEVHAVYTEYRSPIARRPRVVRILPVQPGAGAGSPAGDVERWCHEPSLPAIFDELLDVSLRVQLLDVLLESDASEQGARMMTMEEATERADRALQECRAQHNRLRREAITVDLLGALFASRAAEEAGTAAAGPGPGRRR
jgi:F-type H+-transporting ATPase subunit gamma